MDAPVLTKVDHPPATLRSVVQDRMREAIFDGSFLPGQRLVERPLCDQLGVSRTVVRETIRYLEAEGLVEILPGRGPIVARMSRDDARQIYAIRRMLETAAAEGCARNMTPELGKALKSALAAIRKNKADKTALLLATTEFYGLIFDGAGHGIAWEVVQRLNGRIGRLRTMTLSTKDRQQPGMAHMKAICEAIVSGDPRAARKAVNQHLDDTAAIADRLLAEEAEING